MNFHSHAWNFIRGRAWTAPEVMNFHSLEWKSIGADGEGQASGADRASSSSSIVLVKAPTRSTS